MNLDAISTITNYDQGMGNRGEVFMTWEGFEPGTWSLELWDLMETITGNGMSAEDWF